MTDVAVFDFDGTLSRGDSLLRLLRWHFRVARLLRGGIRLTPVLIGYLLGQVPNWRAKEAVIAEFFGGWSSSALADLCDRFAAEVIPEHLLDPGLARLKWHQDRGDVLVLASASLALYLEPWGRTVRFDYVLATRLEQRHGRATGRIDGLNCYGPEKLRRVQEVVTAASPARLWVYADGQGDSDLARAADMVGWRSFDAVPMSSWRGPRA